MRNPPDLTRHLQDLLAQLPRGRVTTYGTLAEALGDRQAATWVGHYLMHHPHAQACPCHRVLRAGGWLGNYADGPPAAKALRLAEEGVHVDDGRVDLSEYHFDQFTGPAPLVQLRSVQLAFAARRRITRRTRMPRRVGGVDVSYHPSCGAAATYVEVDFASGEQVFTATVRRAVTFPYISSFLAFREMPVLLELIDKVRASQDLADVLMVDGSGVLHPRSAGIATLLGVVCDVPTIGVTKKHLCGEVDFKDIPPGQTRGILHQGRIQGHAVRLPSGQTRPLFVSPGHRADAAFAARVVLGVSLGRRLPEPVYWADRLSRAAARSG